MIHSRGANASDAEIVMTQIIQSIGGGIAAVSTQVSKNHPILTISVSYSSWQVAAQGSVPHFDVAMATAVVLLWTEIGGSIGAAIGSYI